MRHRFALTRSDGRIWRRHDAVRYGLPLPVVVSGRPVLLIVARYFAALLGIARHCPARGVALSRQSGSAGGDTCCSAHQARSRRGTVTPPPPLSRYPALLRSVIASCVIAAVTGAVIASAAAGQRRVSTPAGDSADSGGRKSRSPHCAGLCREEECR